MNDGPRIVLKIGTTSLITDGALDLGKVARLLARDSARHPVSTVESGCAPNTELLISTDHVQIMEDRPMTVSADAEAIITDDIATARRFTQQVDAGSVFVNTSTRYSDGGEFGYGVEIGVSTHKLHARGPMGLTAPTTVKNIVWGSGQVREVA